MPNDASTSPRASAPARVLLDEARVIGGNVAVGDQVKVNPSRPGKHDAYIATVRRISTNAIGDIEIDVFGGRPGHAAHRVYTPDRLRRMTRRAVRA